MPFQSVSRCYDGAAVVGRRRPVVLGAGLAAPPVGGAAAVGSVGAVVSGRFVRSLIRLLDEGN